MTVFSRGGFLPAVLASLLATTPAWAQTGNWNSFVSISPVFEDADLDQGGDFRVAGAIVRAGTSTGFGDGHRAGVVLNYDYFDYSFGDPVAFAGVAPWEIVQRYGLSIPVSFSLGDGWSLGVTPSADWFREDGAEWSDALVWGATLSAVKRFADGNMIGLGVAAFNRLEDSGVVAFPIVDWRFGARWRLINPLAAGPTGPAGLELDYLLDNEWTIGIGAARREVRFRLAEDGPTPNGIGQISGAPIFLRASRDFSRATTLNLYAGVVVSGKLRVEDSDGHLLREEDMDTSPILGVNVTVRF